MLAWHWDGAAFRLCASIPLEDRGFRYGMALFESLRVHRGVPLFLEEHLASLRAACRQREFPFDERALESVASQLRGGAGEQDRFARLYVTAGDGRPGTPVTASRLYVLVEERGQEEPGLERLALSPEVYRPLFGGLKTANYWANLDAYAQARRRGFDEALLFNENAELVSAAMANVFLVHEGRVSTPSLACGARAGVIRAWVLHQVPVQERSLFLRDVQSAEEIFLTNSWRGIAPARQIEDRSLPAPIPCGALLAEAYRRESERQTKPPGD